MRKLLKFSGGILASFLLLCLICLGLILSKVNTSVAKDHKIDTILVLGAKVKANKKPSHIMQERLEAARLLAQKNPQASIIVSGAKRTDEPISEAASMKNYLVGHGIARERIIAETKAQNTAENIYYSKKYFCGKTVVVTSDFHLYRALYLAKRQGLKLMGQATVTSVDVPLAYVSYYSHEVFGLMDAFVFGSIS